jgi:hypothetical protein
MEAMAGTKRTRSASCCVESALKKAILRLYNSSLSLHPLPYSRWTEMSRLLDQAIYEPKKDRCVITLVDILS